MSRAFSDQNSQPSTSNAASRRDSDVQNQSSRNDGSGASLTSNSNNKGPLKKLPSPPSTSRASNNSNSQSDTLSQELSSNTSRSHNSNPSGLDELQLLKDENARLNSLNTGLQNSLDISNDLVSTYENELVESRNRNGLHQQELAALRERIATFEGRTLPVDFQDIMNQQEESERLVAAEKEVASLKRKWGEDSVELKKSEAVNHKLKVSFELAQADKEVEAASKSIYRNLFEDSADASGKDQLRVADEKVITAKADLYRELFVKATADLVNAERQVKKQKQDRADKAQENQFNIEDEE